MVTRGHHTAVAAVVCLQGVMCSTSLLAGRRTDMMDSDRCVVVSVCVWMSATSNKILISDMLQS